MTSLAEFFNCPEMLSPVEYAEKDWAKEPYNGGCPVNFITGGAMKYFVSGLRDAINRLVKRLCTRSAYP